MAAERENTLRGAYKAVGKNAAKGDFDDNMCRKNYRKYVEQVYMDGGTPEPYETWKLANC